MMLYDVTYISPKGITGTHIAVEANNVEEAKIKSPIQLCAGTSSLPEQYEVIDVIEHKK